MFNNNKKKKSMNSNNSGKNLPSVNIISKGTHLEGTLTTKNDVRIAGTIDGEAVSENKVIVSSSGKINGNIKAVEADIAGTIDGEVRVDSKLVLRKSALVKGDIFTKTLLVEEGAQINGACNMGSNNNGKAGGKGSATKSTQKAVKSKKEKQTA